MSLATKLRGLREVWAFDNRLWLFVTKTLFRREHLHIYRYKGMDILVDHAGGDANGAREVLTSPMYSRFIPTMELDGPQNVLDIGASNGGFPLLLASKGVRLKRLVSVELNPRTFTRLHFNLNRNLDCEIKALNAAVCGERRTINVSLGNGGVSDSIYRGAENGEERPYDIDGVTFDDLYEKYFDGETVDVCKIDIEGAEFEIFATPGHRHLAKCRYLIIEIHEGDGRTTAQILPQIEALGFVRQETEPDADPNVHFFINSRIQN